MNIKVYSGRPEEARPLVEENVYKLLLELDISYERADHEEAATMEHCIEIEKALDVGICKNLFLCTRNKSSFYLLIMPGDKPFKTKELSSQINSSRLSFGTAEDMIDMLGVTPGSVSVLALMNDKSGDIQLLVDKDLMKYEWFGCHPCRNTSTLKLKTSDVFDVILKKINHTPLLVELTGEV